MSKKSSQIAITAAAASVAAVGECEQRLWRLIAEASRSPSPARRDQITINSPSISQRKRFTTVARLAAMMRDILASPQFVHPPDEDAWASTHLITFPSDPAWQDICYKKMLERQRIRKMNLLEEQERLQLVKEQEQSGDGKDKNLK